MKIELFASAMLSSNEEARATGGPLPIPRPLIVHSIQFALPRRISAEHFYCFAQGHVIPG